MPRILILLAVYNGKPWLTEQLESILSQEGVQVHVLIGDDLSSDGSLGLIERGWRTDPRVEICSSNRRSGSAGANFRQLYARANLVGFDFIALADQDDVWMPRKLISAVEALDRSGAGGYSCAVQAFWPDGRQVVLNQNPQIRAADFLFEGAGQGCTFVIRGELFARLQQFCRDHRAETEELHYHDWLIYLLARSWGCAWHFDPCAWMHYRQHGGNEIGARGGVQAITRRLALIRNGWLLRQVQAAVRLYILAGGTDHRVRQIADVLPDSACSTRLLRRFRITILIFRHSRRRLSDRLVLVAAALAGFF